MNSPQDLNDFVSDELLCQNLNAAVRQLIHAKPERLLTNYSPLLITKYMTQIVVTSIIRYITHLK